MCKERSTKNQMNYTQKIFNLNKPCNLPNTSSLKSDTRWNNFVSNFKKIMKEELVDHQKSLMKTSKKLENKKAEFLGYIKNTNHKKIINKFRLGNHKLSIKTGRYTVPKTSEHLRSCQMFNTSEIENETHFLLKGNSHNDIRDKYSKEITDRYPVFDTFNKMTKIIFLFNNVENNVYVHQLLHM